MLLTYKLMTLNFCIIICFIHCMTWWHQFVGGDIWLDLCMSFSSSCHHHLHHPCSSTIHNGGIQVLTHPDFPGDSGDNCNYKMCKVPVKSSPPTNQHPKHWVFRVTPRLSYTTSHIFWSPDAILSFQPPVSNCQSMHCKIPNFYAGPIVAPHLQTCPKYS